MHRLALYLLIALTALAPTASHTAQSSGFTYRSFLGDLVFDAGGMETKFLIGTFVKNASISGNTLTLTLRKADDTEETITLATAHPSDAGISEAEAEALIGGFFTGNSETGGITLTYNAGTKKIDVVSALPDTAAAIRSALVDSIAAARTDASGTKALADTSQAVRGALVDSTGRVRAALVDTAAGIRSAIPAIPSYLQSETEVLHSRAGALFWDDINQVPNTPGSSQGVGRILTVHGTGSKDYRWEAGHDGVDQTARDLASAADAQASTNADDIGTNTSNIQQLGTQNNNLQRQITELDRQTADLDIVSDGLGWAEASASDAGIALFAEGSTIGDGLLNDNRDLTQADVDAVTLWRQTIGLGATVQAVVVRIEGTLGPTEFALQQGNTYLPMHSYQKVLSGPQYDYYFIAGLSNSRITINRRSQITHTRFHGELGGRAEGQVNSARDESISTLTNRIIEPTVRVYPPYFAQQRSDRTVKHLMETKQFWISFVGLERLDMDGVDRMTVRVGGTDLISQPFDYDRRYYFGAPTMYPIQTTQELELSVNNSTQIWKPTSDFTASPPNLVHFDVRFYATNDGANAIGDATIKAAISRYVPVLPYDGPAKDVAPWAEFPITEDINIPLSTETNPTVLTVGNPTRSELTQAQIRHTPLGFLLNNGTYDFDIFVVLDDNTATTNLATSRANFLISLEAITQGSSPSTQTLTKTAIGYLRHAGDLTKQAVHTRFRVKVFSTADIDANGPHIVNIRMKTDDAGTGEVQTATAAGGIIGIYQVNSGLVGPKGDKGDPGAGTGTNSTATPQPVKATAAAGTSTHPSHDDHAHTVKLARDGGLEFGTNDSLQVESFDDIQDRLADIEVSTEISYAAAPSAEAQFTAFATSSAGTSVGDKLAAGTFTPADLTGSETWYSTRTLPSLTGSAQYALLIRVHEDQDNHRYSLRLNAPITNDFFLRMNARDADFVGKSGNFNLYHPGSIAPLSTATAEKSQSTQHTAYHGQLPDATILNAAKVSRTTADRAKIFATSSTDENDIVLINPPTGGGGGLNQEAVDNRISALVNDDWILDLAQESRANADRGKLLATAPTNQDSVILIPPPPIVVVTDRDTQPIKATGTRGTGTEAARNDHVHPLKIATNGGLEFITGDSLRATGGGGGGVSLYGSLPRDITAIRSIGTATSASRGDHAHRLQVSSGYFRFADGVGLTVSQPFFNQMALWTAAQHKADRYPPSPDDLNLHPQNFPFIEVFTKVAYDATKINSGDIDPGQIMLNNANDLQAIQAVIRLGATSSSTFTDDDIAQHQLRTGRRVFITTEGLTNTSTTSIPATSWNGVISSHANAPNGAYILDFDTATLNRIALTGGRVKILVESGIHSYVRRSINDDAILDLAKATRVTADRGKFLGISASDENAIALLDAPSGGGGGGQTATQVNTLIQAAVQDWAETGNNDPIPRSPKLNNVNDDFVLDLAQASRASTDRGKVLGTASDNENNLTLLNLPPPGLTQTQVDARVVAGITDDAILDLGEASRTSSDRGKVLGVSKTNEDAVALLDFDPPVWVQAFTAAAQSVSDANEATVQTLTITPRNASTRIFLQAHIDISTTMGGNAAARDVGFQLRLYHGGTQIASRSIRASRYADSEVIANSVSIEFLHSPTSSAAQTYTARFIRTNGNRTYSITNRQIIAHEVLQ